MVYTNVNEIHKQFKMYCNDDDYLSNFYEAFIINDVSMRDYEYHINIGDYDNDFINEFINNNFCHFNIDYEKIKGLNYNNALDFLFEWTDEKHKIVDDYIYKETQKLFEKKYAYDVEDKLNKIHQENIADVFEDDLMCLSYDIALNKVKRSKIYNFGLGLKLNMRDAGII